MNLRVKRTKTKYLVDFVEQKTKEMLSNLTGKYLVDFVEQKSKEMLTNLTGRSHKSIPFNRLDNYNLKWEGWPDGIPFTSFADKNQHDLTILKTALTDGTLKLVKLKTEYSADPPTLELFTLLKNAGMKSSQFEINAKLKLTNVPGDGNCGYWAIKNQLDGENISEIREKALKELELNRTSYEKSFGGENFENVKERIVWTESGSVPQEKWMSSDVLEVLANAYKRPVIVMSTERQEHHLPYLVPIDKWNPVPILLYHQGFHYNVAERKEGAIINIPGPRTSLLYNKKKNRRNPSRIDPALLCEYFNKSPFYNYTSMTVCSPEEEDESCDIICCGDSDEEMESDNSRAQDEAKIQFGKKTYAVTEPSPKRSRIGDHHVR
jgi:hypothetical protein